MINHFINSNLIPFVLLAIFLALPTDANAQSTTSTGRTAGVTETLNDNEFRAMQRIRNHLNKGEYDRAQSRSERIIRTEDRRDRAGMSKSELYKEAYNALCVSLTNLGELEEAFTACDTSIGLTPNHWESLKTRATLYYMVQDFQMSLADFELSLEHAPENEELSQILRDNIAVVRSKIN